MITINQLLESVDLDFEPRWVTKDKSGSVCLYEHKPQKDEKHKCWLANHFDDGMAEYINLKLAEFDGKDWTECIYEVPRKTYEYEQNLEKLRPADSDLVYRVKLPRKTTGKIEKIEGYTTDKILAKVNEIIDWINKVDAVNELKGAKNDK